MSGTETAEIACPYCGETIEIVIDCSVESQKYIEDCQVCCRPITISVTLGTEGEPLIEAATEDDI